MKLNIPTVPLEKTDLHKILPLMTLTKAAKLALKSGTSPDTILDVAVECGYTRAGGHHALREAGHRTRKVRSDKGRTIRNRIQKLIDQARELESKLAQQEGGSPGGQ